VLRAKILRQINFGSAAGLPVRHHPGTELTEKSQDPVPQLRVRGRMVGDWFHLRGIERELLDRRQLAIAPPVQPPGERRQHQK
jgi:hypothetical protein